MLKPIARSAFALTVLIGAVQAQTLEGINLGTHVSGPQLTTADLQGRVVMFEYWGVNCGPCIASIPHVSKLRDKYDPTVFQIVANQCQTRDVEEAAAKWSKSGGTDSVAVINHGSLPGANVSGIPRVFVFDHKGKLVYDGSPFGGLDDAIDTAVRKAPGALVAGMDFEALKSEAEKIGRQKGNIRSTLNKLEKIVADQNGDEQERKEAEFLLERVTTWANDGQKMIAELQATNPVECMAELELRHDLLKGHALGEFYEARYKELKKDKDYKNEVKAYEKLVVMLAKGREMGAFSSSDSRDTQMAKAGFRKACESFIKRNEGTIAAKELEGRLAKL